MNIIRCTVSEIIWLKVGVNHAYGKSQYRQFDCASKDASLVVVQRRNADGIQSAHGWSWGVGEQERALTGD